MSDPGPRRLRRQRLVAHLHRCGARPVLEALIAVAGGDDLDATLEDFANLRPEAYRRCGADTLPMKAWHVIDGGRR